MQIRHIRDAFGVIHATLALVDGKFGLAVRNPIDPVNKKLGVAKAVGRAKGRKPSKLSTVYEHWVDIKGSAYMVHINWLIKEAVEDMLAREQQCCF